MDHVASNKIQTLALLKTVFLPILLLKMESNNYLSYIGKMASVIQNLILLLKHAGVFKSIFVLFSKMKIIFFLSDSQRDTNFL